MRELDVGPHEPSPVRVQRIVARVVDHGGGGTREGRGAELAIHLVERHLDVEDGRLLEGVAQDDAPGRGEDPRRLQQATVADEVEAVPVLLLAEARHEQLVPVAEQIGLPERGEQPAAAEADAGEVGLGAAVPARPAGGTVPGAAEGTAPAAAAGISVVPHCTQNFAPG